VPRAGDVAVPSTVGSEGQHRQARELGRTARSCQNSIAAWCLTVTWSCRGWSAATRVDKYVPLLCSLSLCFSFVVVQIDRHQPPSEFLQPSQSFRCADHVFLPVTVASTSPPTHSCRMCPQNSPRRCWQGWRRRVGIRFDLHLIIWSSHRTSRTICRRSTTIRAGPCRCRGRDRPDGTILYSEVKPRLHPQARGPKT